MTTKNAVVEVYVRDPDTQEIMNVETGVGTTEDDGATVVIPAGYCSSIGLAAPADIKITVTPLPVVTQPAGFLARSEDTENALSTLTFNLTP